MGRNIKTNTTSKFIGPQMFDEDLKVCKYCGSKPYVRDYNTRFEVCCPKKDNITVLSFVSKQDAKDKWNKEN